MTGGQTQTERDGAHRGETPVGGASLAGRRARTVASSVLIMTGTVAFWIAVSGPLLESSAAAERAEIQAPPGTTMTPGSLAGALSGWGAAVSHPVFGAIAAVCAIAPVLWALAAWRRSPWARIAGTALCAVAFVSFAFALTHDPLRAELEPRLGTLVVRSPGTVSATDLVRLYTRIQTETWHPATGAWHWLVGAAFLALSFVVLPAPQRRPIDD